MEGVVGPSRAKNCEEYDGEVHFCVAPQKFAKSSTRKRGTVTRKPKEFFFLHLKKLIFRTDPGSGLPAGPPKVKFFPMRFPAVKKDEEKTGPRAHKNWL